MPTILIVDDDLHLTHILAYRFGLAGFAVLTANDTDRAFELACTRLPDLIVADFRMWPINGAQFCVNLRANPDTSHIPVLMLTARGKQVRASELQNTNVQRLMEKPFSARELLDAASEMLAPAVPSE